MCFYAGNGGHILSLLSYCRCGVESIGTNTAKQPTCTVWPRLALHAPTVATLPLLPLQGQHGTAATTAGQCLYAVALTGAPASTIRIYGSTAPRVPMPGVIVGVLQVGVFDREPTKSWVRGPVTLAGDAAAPMPPNLGQGGNKALENAGVLAACLET